MRKKGHRHGKQSKFRSPGLKMPLKFAFSSDKALEALAFVANEHPGFSPLFVSKVFFYAEKWHLNRYGRPVIADTFIAMPLGPVPSTIKNFIDQNWDWAEKPEGFDKAIRLERRDGFLRLIAAEKVTEFPRLSESDIECLRDAIAFCRDKTAQELSDATHLEKAWAKADPNRPMDYEDFVDDDNPHKDAVIEMAREASRCAVL
jgi:uncharacterized phage-associated protein